MEDLEQYTRINNIIITGHKIKSQAYTAVREMDVNSTEQQAAAFLYFKGCANTDTERNKNIKNRD